MPQYVFYHVQKDMGSDPLHPEAFVINKDSGITVGDVVNNFPLRNYGNYHLRFRLPLQEGYLWLDAQDLAQKAPLYNGSIFLSVLNIDKMGKPSQRTPLIDSIPKDSQNVYSNSQSNDEDETSEYIYEEEPELVEEQQEQEREPSNSIKTNDFLKQTDSPLSEMDVSPTSNDGQSSVSTPADDDAIFEFISTPMADDANDNGDDTSDDDEMASPSNKKAAMHVSTESTESDNFLHFGDTPRNNKHVEPSNVQVEKAEVSDKVKQISKSIVIDEEASKMTGTNYEGKSDYVVKAMKEREEKLREAQIQAIAEKKEREVEEEKNQEERYIAHQELGKKLDTWANDQGGERKNIRTLLCTMQTVMWANSGWKDVAMTQVLDPEKVKLFYRKALLKVHPDKNTGCPADQVYIAQRVFEALNQAWAKFQDQQNNTFQPGMAMPSM
ncbi:hypothetical protein WA158_006317 [Blastocystis sp. Blastoise]